MRALSTESTSSSRGTSTSGRLGSWGISFARFPGRKPLLNFHGPESQHQQEDGNYEPDFSIQNPLGIVLFPDPKSIEWRSPALVHPLVGNHFHLGFILKPVDDTDHPGRTDVDDGRVDGKFHDPLNDGNTVGAREVDNGNRYNHADDIKDRISLEMCDQTFHRLTLFCQQSIIGGAIFAIAPGEFRQKHPVNTVPAGYVQ